MFNYKIAKKFFSYLLVHPGVQQGLGRLVYQGVPLIETRKELTTLLRMTSGRHESLSVCLHSKSQLLRICVQELWYIVLLYPQWVANILLCFQSSFIHRCFREWIKVEGQADLSPLFQELLRGQIDLGVLEGPEKYPNSFKIVSWLLCLIQVVNDWQVARPYTTASMSLR